MLNPMAEETQSDFGRNRGDRKKGFFGPKS